MPFLVTAGAPLLCTFGTGPCSLTVIQAGSQITGPSAFANIMDYVPFKNITGFIMCTSLSNPTVAAATTAALGVLTPMPCVPVLVAPWMPGSLFTKINNMPALTDSCKCMCAWGGSISITFAGQVIVKE